MKVNEENFISYIEKKSPKGLDYAVDSYSKLVYKVVYSILGTGFHVHSIDECVNDIFLALWNNIDCFDEKKGSFKNWIIAISRYKAIDYRRQLLKDTNLEFDESLVERDKLLTNESDAENILLMKEKREKLLKMINELNDVDRDIFIKRYFLDEEIQNIAEDLEVKRSVVDNRLSRGRKTLKEKLIALKEEII
ncbi:RNA polymerase factor sigma-70 RpoD [Gottschalkia acidurici 9a]|uniref:RNA polymerase factor sigma-70 RpoD n=1 Tax=Gottschalkia acidurici (strain ATCC 7906 / DSM 604 / BCRC 14475 / CIP 104303 / KCTC 5404 / NCIMB 10678 / 9a) TaxID=1128398 RepID=K0B0C1_GOTA9|nr:sigma-70 family RNA polymerase sigma factor [Gottschalkia acidurici]AFS79483.1 RNA polymerase factor sigma-70 RpoD [Gottschalkia acidurici 9a]